ncbi:MAG: excinuclease ABC subunit UvrC [Bdellovibrionaceae bacterium]|jgi:excinuclease ABC subunit C|nr:excinuclease ABC subunit UvrC [Pseudobdellovibrionaceae bacterium]
MNLLDELKDLVKTFPSTPGVYLMKNENGKIIYVGKAKNLKSRVRSYLVKSSDHSLKTKFLVSRIKNIEYLLTETEVEAFLLEASLIKKHQPRYNIRLKDDKSYPYLKCRLKHDFPNFELTRRVKNDGSVYFGPYTSGYSVRETIDFLNKTYLLRDCTDSFLKSRKRACMSHQVGKCSAPCVDLISKRKYQNAAKKAIEFLKAPDDDLLEKMTKKMEKASKDERFEVAAEHRDRIKAIQSIWEKQYVVDELKEGSKDVFSYYGDERGTLIESLHIRNGRMIGNRNYFIPKLDVFAEHEDPKEWLTSFLNQYYSENLVPQAIVLPNDLGQDLYHLLSDVFEQKQGTRPIFSFITNGMEDHLMAMAYKNAKSHFKNKLSTAENKKKGLEEIQRKLKLPALPIRIECYDISHFQGQETVASQVVFEEGIPKKSDYRKYKLITVAKPDDYLSMKEVLERRLKHTEYDDPQLILIDGGKGQLNIVVQVLKEMGRESLPVVGLAKSRALGEFDDTTVEKTQERFYLPNRQNPVVFREASEAYQILIQLRDEAHRFAITFQRQLRDKKFFEGTEK